MGLAAELAEVDAADLAALLGLSLPAQVAAQRTVRHQGLQEDLVQRQVVGAQPLRAGRRKVYLSVTDRTEHGDGGPARFPAPRLPGSLRPAPRAPGRAHGEGLQLADAVGAEGVQAGQDLGLSVQALTHGAQRPGVHRAPRRLLRVFSAVTTRHFTVFRCGKGKNCVREATSPSRLREKLLFNFSSA